MHKEIWISSHITRQEGLGYLTSCLNSLLSLPKDVIVVISYSGLMIELTDNIVQYQHNNKLTQFDHIKYIFEQRNTLLKDNDLILFLDDDDMLLTESNVEYVGYKINRNGKIEYVKYFMKNPFDDITDEIPGIVGKHILGRSSEDQFWCAITKDEIPIFCSSEERELIEDFSGTIIRKQYLEEFFNKRDEEKIISTAIIYSKFVAFANKYIENTTDVRFMDYIEELQSKMGVTNISHNPTIFHRLKEYKSEWMY